MRLFLRPTVFLLLIFSLGWTPQARAASVNAFHTKTQWDLKPSLKYDALCLINALTGDPYYLKFYQAEYDHFHPLFTPEEQAALLTLKRIIKDEQKGIISASLSMILSSVDDETLPAMIQTMHDSRNLKIAFRQSPYWGDDVWQVYESVQPSLEVVLRALDRVGFAEYWEKNAKPKAEKRIHELQPELPKYNIVPAIEGRIGFPLPSEVITVYLLNYSEPHGIRISGLRFLTHSSYPFRIVLHNAIHETMHPPFHRDDPAVKAAIAQLGQDPLVLNKVQHHDPSFGYNSTDGYIEEDSVQALEEIVSEQFEVGRNPCKYWRDQDEGMHVLAVALYLGYKKAEAGPSQTYSDWLVREVKSGSLRGETLKKTVDDFFASPTCH